MTIGISITITTSYFVDLCYQKFDLGVTGDIVVHFLQPYFYKGHAVYIDNWYTSPTLAEFLHGRDTGMCVTVKANRKGMPKLESKLFRGEVQVSHSDVWVAVRWKINVAFACLHVCTNFNSVQLEKKLSNK